jgi:tetratricopeptide (TPR) repeat protein
MGYGNACVLVGDLAEGLGFFDEAEQLSRDRPDPGVRLEAGMLAAWAQLSLGRLREASERCEPIIGSGCRHQAAMGAPVDSMAANIHCWSLFERGLLGASAEASQTVKRLQEGARVGALANAARDMTDCRVLAHRGEIDRALRVAGDLMDGAERTRNANLMSVALMCIGEIEILGGRPSQARSALEEARRVARDAETMLNLEARILFLLARAYLGEGAEAEAVATSEDAISIAQLRGSRHHEAAAYVARADVLLATSALDRRGEIESAHASAAELIEETGAGIVTPDFYLSRARMAELLGDRDGRTSALENALQSLEAMGARRRVSEVVRQLAS